MERCPLPVILSVHICSISDEELNNLGVSILIYQDYHTMCRKFNPNTMTWMISKHICEMYLFKYIYQHNCLYTYFRHGNHSVDDLTTLLIATKWIYAFIYLHINVYLFNPDTYCWWYDMYVIHMYTWILLHIQYIQYIYNNQRFFSKCLVFCNLSVGCRTAFSFRKWPTIRTVHAHYGVNFLAVQWGIRKTFFLTTL